MEKIISLILLLCTSFGAISQQDSLNIIRKKQFHNSLLLPIGLAITSVILNKKSTKINLQAEIFNKIDSGFHTKVDDIIQYVPIAQMYAADMLKLPAKNNWKVQTKNLLLSELFTGIVVHSLKRTINTIRPDGKKYSYPSGHTSQAFVTSQVLYQEFKDSNKLIAYSGYLFATSTGVLRVLNNRHWVPDVLLGAGIAIGITNLVYYVNPLKNWKMFQEKGAENSLRIIPIYNSQFTGASFSFKF